MKRGETRATEINIYYTIFFFLLFFSCKTSIEPLNGPINQYQVGNKLYIDFEYIQKSQPLALDGRNG